MRKQLKKMNLLTRKNVIFVSALAAIGLIIGGYAIWNNWPSTPIQYSMELAEDTSLESHSLVVGDIYWGREMRIWANDWAKSTGRSAAEYPFHQLGSFSREKYDTWIGNLECPTIPGVDLSFEYEKEKLAFNCPIEYLPEFAKWFGIASLANNHAYNAESYTDYDRDESIAITREQLDKQSVQHFGSYTPHKLKDVCEVVAMPARASFSGRQENVSIPVAMCGYHGAYYTITDKALAVMKEYSKHMPVFAFPHMGQEYQAISDEVRQKLYRKMIDNGADAVFGNHPHWVQPTEAYKGKLIVYSMGNFIFDQQFSTEVMRSVAIDMTLTLKKESVNEEQLRQWTRLGQNCEIFQNNCFDAIKEQNLQRPPLSLEYDIVSVNLDNRITKRADIHQHREILERLKWADTQQQLSN